ncbi:TonB-dependent receptor domain-containing protein [Novosphingopyxis iocasae]|uniref:TonB-dependent receptor domain-containing protein n=1 Tax=Novosphingopyxis iocasae TaxID=2762729 RepID=UPI001650DA76|nr:TonB-dependent receptor [Novosphingopyxis iocasae]
MKTQTLSRLKLSAAPFAMGLALVSVPAMAQIGPEETADTDVSANGPAIGEPIVVTGTRIRSPNLESASPVTVVSAQEFKDSGSVRVEDLLNSLPQVLGGQNAFIANGASGTATVDVRGLGPARTLVLVNGRRLQPGDPGLPVADINQIPASLIERVEVLTGGASATYGADAVAGVVNFVMNTDFEGVQLNSQYGLYQHDNGTDQVIRPDGQTILDRNAARGFNPPSGNTASGSQFSVELTLGAGFDDGRGHVTAYAGYREVNALFLGDRDYSFCALTGSRNGVSCGGSSTAPYATVTDPNFDLFGALVADGSDNFGRPYAAYNYNPINYFQRPDERYTAGFFADYEITPGVTAYSEFMFMDDRSQAQIAQSGTFFADTYNIACDSPILTPGQGATLCGLIDGNPDRGDFANGVDPTGAGVVPILLGKRNIEGGPRFDDLRHTAYRAVAGVRGDLTENIRYDLSGQYGTTIFSQVYNNDFSRSRLRNALQARIDADGNVVCQSVIDGSDPNCAVYNPFQGPGIVGGTDPRAGITQAAIDYVNIPLLSKGEVEETIVNGFISGDLFSIGSASPVGFAAGAEYRKEKLSTRNDLAFQTQDGAGQGSPQLDVDGQFDVTEVFAEANIPVIENGFIDELSFELGYRYSNYSTGVTTDTYKALVNFAPIPAVRFRGGYNRAVRAPNILNLFSPNRVALFSGSDPCAGATPDYTQAQCVNLGVPASRYGTVAASPAGQYNQFIGGNPNVEPEKADTYTAGVVIQPQSILPGFVASVDYFNINVDNAISSIGAQTALNQCGLTGDPLFCNLVNRAPGSLTLWTPGSFVTNTTQNIGGVKTSGVDVSASYSRAIGPGGLSLSFNGSYLAEFVIDTGIPGTDTDGKYDCTGYHGLVCGTPRPEWRHQLRAGYTLDSGIGISGRWRYYGPVQWDQRSDDLDLGTGAEATPGDIGAQSYFDLTLSFAVDPMVLRLGVNNILDREPPIIASGYGGTNGNTYTETYDPVGRFLFANVTFDF